MATGFPRHHLHHFPSTPSLAPDCGCFLHHSIALPRQTPSSTPTTSHRSARLRTTLRSNSLKRHDAPRETPTQKPSTSSPANRVDVDPNITHSGKLPFGSFSLFLQRLREDIVFDRLAIDILSIALPAALALAADPITSLVDTVFVGRLGSVDLAAVGVSVSVFNLVSKLFNVPLLNITTSFVAEEQAFILADDVDESNISSENCKASNQGKIILPSVSTSLILAASLGLFEALALSVGSDFLLNTLGVSVDSPMRVPAEQFLTLRAFGAPPIVIALAAQGTFRGFKDTKTPLYAIVLFFFHWTMFFAMFLCACQLLATC